jgi:transcriptional regulator GlxA family with amidase domain
MRIPYGEFALGAGASSHTPERVRRRAGAPDADAAAGAKRIIGIAYPGSVLLDLAGPMEVFHFAADQMCEEGVAQALLYRVEIWAVETECVQTMSGLRVSATQAVGNDLRDVDTILIPGAKSGQPEIYRDRKLLEWLKDAAGKVRRVAAVGSGAFVLAEAGLLEGRRATTHWRDTELLKRAYANINVVKDVMFTRDGSIYTSAGVAGGIDQALAMVEEDYGRALSLKVARRLVVFYRRPGDQAQLSTLLALQAKSVRFGDLIDRIYCSLRQDLSVPRLAEMAAMSPRNFTRVFREELGLAPAECVRAVRVDVARRLLSEGADQLGAVARECGFASEEQMRRAFKTVLGMCPRVFHGRSGAQILGRPALVGEDSRAAPLSWGSGWGRVRK